MDEIITVNSSVKSYKFVDVSGFGHSGKGVAADLLHEFHGYQVPIANFEFNLTRIQGGLLDLQTALQDDWSPIRSDAAIRRFENLILRMGQKARFQQPKSLFLANGMNYDAFFNEQFTPLSKAYLASLVNYTYTSEWPYISLEDAPIKLFYERLLVNFKLKKTFPRDVFFAAPTDFLPKTRQYLNALFASIAETETTHFVTLNGFEPFNPTRAANLFNNARSIIVNRDARDTYASTLVTEGTYIPDYEKAHFWQMKRNFLSTDNIEHYVRRQRLYYQQSKKYADDERVTPQF